MIPIDWTKRDRPYTQDGTVYYRYKTQLDTPDISSAQLRQWNRSGIRELLEYYSKVTDETPADILSSSLERLDYILDPRPRCNIVYILVSISKIDLGKIDFISTDILEDSDIVRRSVFINTFNLDSDLEFIYSKLNSIIAKQNRTSFVLYYNSIKQSRNTKLLFSKFFDGLFNILDENDIDISFDREDEIAIFFTEDFRIVAMTFNGNLLRIGVNQINRRPGFNVKMINDLVSNFPTVVADSRIEIISEQDNRWIEFYRSNLSGNFFVNEDEGMKLRDKMAEKYSIDNILRRSFVDSEDLKHLNNSVKEALRQDIERVNQSRILEVDNCSDVQASDLIRFYKTAQEKEYEDALIDNPFIRATYTERTFNIADYVGDEILDALLEGNVLESFHDVGDIYDLVLNSINIDVLMTKILRCLAQDVDFTIPKICIDVYNPLVIPLPDLSGFTGIFDFISDLVRKALLAAISELLQTFIEFIFDILDECARLSEQGDDIYSLDRSPRQYFDGDEQIAIEQMFEKIRDLYDELDSARDIASDEDLSQFLDDVVAALTPVEFCRLVSGNAGRIVLDVVLCIIEARYPNINKVVETREEVASLFNSLSFILDTSICDALIDEIPSGDICATPEQLDFRGALLADKEYSPDLIDQQLEKIRNKRLEQIDFARDMLGGDLSNVMFAELSPEQFVMKAIPAVSDNEPARHMVNITVDAVVDPIRDSFETLTLGPGGLQETLPDFLSSEISNNFSSPNFSLITDQGLRFNSSRFGFDLNLNSQEDVFVIGTNVLTSDNKSGEYSSRRAAFDDLVDYDTLTNSELYDRVLLTCVTELKRDILNFPTNFNADEFFARAVPVDETPKIFENCWRKGENVRSGISEAFYEKEKTTKNPVDLMDTTIEGVAYLMIQSFVLDYLFKNLTTISRYQFDTFSDKLINKYLIAAIRRYYSEIDNVIDNFSDDDFSEIVSRQVNDVYKQISFVLPSQPVKDRFFGKFSILDGDETLNIGGFGLNISNFVFRKFIRDKSTDQLFNPNTLPSGLLGLTESIFDSYEWVLQFRFKDQQFAGSETTLLEVTRDYEQDFPADLIDELINSDAASALFDYAVPLETIVSSLSIYIVELFSNRDNYFELKELIRIILTNTINLLEFQFKNEEVDNFVRERKKRSFEG